MTSLLILFGASLFDTMTTEAWITLIGIGVTITLAVGGWMTSVNGKLGRIAQAVSVIPDIWDKFETHEKKFEQQERRLDHHSKRFADYKLQLVKLKAEIASSLPPAESGKTEDKPRRRHKLDDSV